MAQKTKFKPEYILWILGLWAVVNVVLKLLNIIKWSWLLVLAPLWAPFAFIYIPISLYMIWFYYNHKSNNQ